MSSECEQEEQAVARRGMLASRVLGETLDLPDDSSDEVLTHSEAFARRAQFLVKLAVDAYETEGFSEIETCGGFGQYACWGQLDPVGTARFPRPAQLDLRSTFFETGDQGTGLIAQFVLGTQGAAPDPEAHAGGFSGYILHLPDMGPIGVEPIRLPGVAFECLLESGEGAAAQSLRTLSQSVGLSFVRKDRIGSYLSRHQDLIQITAELAEHVRRRFPAPDQLVLEMFSDPESNDEFLILNVRQAEYSEDLIQVLEELSEPFESRLSRASGWLVLSSDFNEPE